MALATINPTTGQAIESYAELSDRQIELALDESEQAYQSWRKLEFRERAPLLKSAAARLRQGQDRFARLMALEMGKPLAQGLSEVEKCAWGCDYFADQAEALLQREMVETEASKSFVTFQPMGVILAVMPWNFPFWQVFRCAAPALMAGNALVLKHASNVSGCALAIEQIFREAGLAKGHRTIGGGELFCE